MPTTDAVVLPFPPEEKTDPPNVSVPDDPPVPGSKPETVVLPTAFLAAPFPVPVPATAPVLTAAMVIVKAERGTTETSKFKT
jgi:hypothetical protein